MFQRTEKPNVGLVKPVRRAAVACEITDPEEVASGDDGGAHRSIFMCALRPVQILADPKCETHNGIIRYMRRRMFIPTVAGIGALASQQIAHAAARPGRLKQCVTRGCFGRGSKMTFDEMCMNAAKMGVVGFDLIGPQDFPTLKKHGLIPTMVPGGSSIPDGTNDKALHDGIEKRMREAIDAAAAAGAPNVIALAGNRKGRKDEEGLDNTIIFFNRIKKYAEDKNITLNLELLNSKVNHPDYNCDHTAWGVEVCKRVDSPKVKLLFDIYHMQIMEGDIIRTIQNNFKYLGHFHTAGNPGRHEMDDTQEMNYRGIAKAIAALGYTGYIAHEYSPLGDPLTSLESTLKLFEV